jgi:hypothetical protein
MKRLFFIITCALLSTQTFGAGILVKTRSILDNESNKQFHIGMYIREMGLRHNSQVKMIARLENPEEEIFGDYFETTLTAQYGSDTTWNYQQRMELEKDSKYTHLGFYLAVEPTNSDLTPYFERGLRMGHLSDIMDQGLPEYSNLDGSFHSGSFHLTEESRQQDGFEYGYYRIKINEAVESTGSVPFTRNKLIRVIGEI